MPSYALSLSASLFFPVRDMLLMKRLCRQLQISFILLSIFFLLSFTILSGYFYRKYLLSRRRDLNELITSLQSFPSTDRTFSKRFQSSNLPVHFTESLQHYLSTPCQSYLIVYSETGLGNRLQAISSAFLLAFLSRRCLLIHWPVTFLSGCQFHQLFQSPISLSSVLLNSHTPEYLLAHSEYLTFHGPFDELLCHSNFTLFKQDSQFLFLSTDEYFLSVLMKNPAYSQTIFSGVEEDVLFQSLVNYLFEPTKELQEQIQISSAKIGFCHKGIHMRKDGLKQIPTNGEQVFLGSFIIGFSFRG